MMEMFDVTGCYKQAINVLAVFLLLSHFPATLKFRSEPRLRVTGNDMIH